MIAIQGQHCEDGHVAECEDCGELFIQEDPEVDYCSECERRLS